MGRLTGLRGRGRVFRAIVAALVLLAGAGAATAVAMLGTHDGADSRSRAARVSAERWQAAATVAQVRAAVARIPAAPPVAPDADAPHRPGAAYYARTAAEHVPASTGPGFLPLYREAERVFGVSWRLIASIHRQETAFSTEPSTYMGVNSFGCCAGPMQFNITNGPVSTWTTYKQAFKQARRPDGYPHRTTFHPSVYDDFDAIMAAGALLRDAGATGDLDGGSWLSAYAYYGHDDFGITYASQVLGRARTWERTGFCLNCPTDASLVAAFDDAYGVHEREVLAAAGTDAAKEKRAKAKRKAKARRARAAKKRRATERAAAEEKAQANSERRRKAAKKAPATRTKPKATTKAPPAKTTTTTAPAPTAPAAPAPTTTTAPPAQTGPTCATPGLLGCGG